MAVKEATWDSNDLVLYENVKIVSKPDWVRFRFCMQIQHGEEIVILHIGHYYREAAVKAFETIAIGEVVDLWVLPLAWQIGNRSGTQLHYYKVKES